jgi:hypothetical protein
VAAALAATAKEINTAKKGDHPRTNKQSPPPKNKQKKHGGGSPKINTGWKALLLRLELSLLVAVRASALYHRSTV